jgi:hypothetical protein
MYDNNNQRQNSNAGVEMAKRAARPGPDEARPALA